jgi:toxin FitB
LIVIDSSAWVEYFTQGPAGPDVKGFVYGDEPVLVPTVVVYEVFRAIRRKAGPRTAATAVAQLSKRQVAEIDVSLALAAANVASEHGLHMADAMIYAATLSVGGTLVTLDAHFEGLPNVVCLRREPPPRKTKK